ncbi:MAG: hypothetical protein VX028_02175 [Nanoarchaeota archaeon]|nr:hypothetical protein [Nanoarchaeota archaeon]
MKKYDVEKQPKPNVKEEIARYLSSNISNENLSLDQLKSLREDLDLHIELKETEEEMDRGEFYTEEEFKKRLDEHMLSIQKNPKKIGN